MVMIEVWLAYCHGVGWS